MIAMDKILIRGLDFYGYHGASDEEQVVGHRFIADATLTVDTHSAGQSDNLAETVSYADIAAKIIDIIRAALINAITICRN